MSFDNSVMLWGLAIIPIMIALLYISWKHYTRFESSKAINVFSHASNPPSWRARLIFGSLRCLAMAFIVLALCEPQIEYTGTEKQYDNVRIWAVTDVSNSMVYAEDIQPNRLEATKRELLKFYSKFDGNYQVAVVPFAGTPNVYYSPPTHSRQTYVSMTKKLGIEAAPSPGTDLPLAIDALDKYFKANKLDQSGVNVVFVITDGGKEEAESTNRLKLFTTTQEMTKKNTRFHIIGVGGKEKTQLVIRDSEGGFRGFLEAETGGVAFSHLDSAFLQQLADNCGADYKSFEKDDLHTFLWDSVQSHHAEFKVVPVAKKMALQGYFFAGAVVLLIICFLSSRTLYNPFQRS